MQNNRLKSHAQPNMNLKIHLIYLQNILKASSDGHEIGINHYHHFD